MCCGRHSTRNYHSWNQDGKEPRPLKCGALAGEAPRAKMTSASALRHSPKSPSAVNFPNSQGPTNFTDRMARQQLGGNLNEIPIRHSNL